MSVSIAVGVSEASEAGAACAEAAASAAAQLGGDCDLALCFAAAPHLGDLDATLAAIHGELAPAALIGCGAGGVVAAGREIERGPATAVWALSAPDARVATHHLETERADHGFAVTGLSEAADLGEAMLVLADPHTFSAEVLLSELDRSRPGMPVLGGLASAAAGGASVLFRDREVLRAGAVACSLSGVPIVPCVSQGATPVGPEMTVTAVQGHMIAELASQPAIERVRDAVAELEPREQALVAQGLMLGIVIDENQPEYERGDFLVRPVVGADPQAGALAVGERVRVGQTVRLHVRDGATADADLRAALRAQSQALASEGAAGALLFTCNGRGRQMFALPDHDATALGDALGAPAAGFFCAGEIGPVGGRNFLHGFTATIAVFAKGS